MREKRTPKRINIDVCERIQISCTQMATILEYVPTPAHTPPIRQDALLGVCVFQGVFVEEVHHTKEVKHITEKETGKQKGQTYK